MNTTRLQQIARVVREARVEAGLSQAELADKVGVHKQTIGNLERASHTSAPELLDRLRIELGVNLSASSLATQAAIDMVCAELADRVHGLDEAQGLMLVAETLNYVQGWIPPARPAMDAAERSRSV